MLVKANKQQYRSRRDFIQDMRQMVWNAKLFNCIDIAEEPIIYQAAVELRTAAYRMLARRATDLEEAEKALETYDESWSVNVDVERERECMHEGGGGGAPILNESVVDAVLGGWVFMWFVAR
jgi:hypothetical protein